MNKNDLSQKWSKYCNTDKLVDDMMDLLREYKHKFSEHGVCTLLDKYFTNKEPLIKLFETSNHYIGDMRISLKREFDRRISENEISSFFCNIHEKMDSKKILQYTDDKGKTFIDYLSAGHKLLSISDLPNEDAQTEKLKCLSLFKYSNMASIASNKTFDDFDVFMHFFKCHSRSSILEDYRIESDDKKVPVLKKGTKTSRAFNTVCKYYGVDKFNPQTVQVERDGVMIERTVYPYDKVFAQYSDLVSDLKRKMNFVISLNPLDYLTMSFGVNWISCHNIRSGGWKGGCLSYMLDTTSMVTYVVENLEAPIHKIPKVYRQMYHYDNNLFVQNRLYPQGNDGATDLYKKFREIVIDEFSELLDVEGDWGCEIGHYVVSSHVYSTGRHYKDYNSNSSCSIFYPKEKENSVLTHVMTIGHEGICLRCGGEFSHNSYLFHPYSSDCVRY